MNQAWAIDGDGIIWSCTDHSLFRYDGTSWAEFPIGPYVSDRQFTTVATQDDGTIWAVNDLGILRVRDGDYTQYTKNAELPNTVSVDVEVDAADQSGRFSATPSAWNSPAPHGSRQAIRS